MGCNCRKNKPPTGSQTTPPTGSTSNSGVSDNPATSRLHSYVLQGNGFTQTFGSRLEARAAQMRRGGTVHRAG